MAAAIILILSVISLLFGTQLGGEEPSKEAFLFLGIITGAATIFLFQSNNKALSAAANGT